MAQHDYVISNAAGASVRADLNNALAAIVSQNSGLLQPSTTYAYQPWADTTTGDLKIRNAANNAWIVVGTLADVGLGLLSRAGGTMTGDLVMGSQSDLRFGDADNSNYVGFQGPATVATNLVWTLPAADGTADQTLGTNGSAALSWVTRARIVAGTSVNTTSGTSIDFTSIPSWVKRITVMFNGVSTSGTSVVESRLGTSGGVQASGYNCIASSITGANTSGTSSSDTGAVVVGSTAAASRVGSIVFSLFAGNSWSFSGVTADLSSSATAHAAGLVSLSGALDRLRITTVNGTDTFDAGSVNIIYEG